MRVFFILLVLLVILPFVSAIDSSLNCQYQESIQVKELRQVLVNDEGDVVPEPLEAGEVTVKSSGSPCWFSFPVENDANYRVSAMYSYQLNVTDSTGSYVHDDSFGVVVDPLGTASVGRSWEDVSSCSFFEGSISVKYQNSLDLKVESREVIVDAWKCRECNGKICLDDGDSAELPQDCGSGLIQDGKCVSECGDSFLPCDNYCLQVNAKGPGSTYDCQFQCQSNLGIDGVCIQCTGDAHCPLGVCNQQTNRCVEYYEGNFGCDLRGSDYIPCEATNTCILPSSRMNGEGYACETECISGRGVDGVCRMNIRTIMLYSLGIIVFIILLVVVFVTGAKYLHQKVVIQKVKAQADLIKQKQESLDKEKQTLLEIKEAKEELVKSEKKNLKELKSIRKRAEEEEIRINKRRNEIKKANDKLFSEIAGIEPKKYTNKQNYAVSRNINGYEVFVNSDGSEGGLFHRFWAKKQIFEPNKEWFVEKYGSPHIWDYEVHHIDSDHANNATNNLVIIPHEVHKKIDHGKIPQGDREAGIAQMKRHSIKQPHIMDL